MPSPDDPDRSLSQEEADRWVEVFLTSLREHLWSANPRWNTRGEDLAVESVGVEGQYPDTEAVIVFRDAQWPDCRFGYRWGPLWQDEPEFMGTIAWANFEEVRVADVPADGHPTEITWLLEPSGCGWGQTTWKRCGANGRPQQKSTTGPRTPWSIPTRSPSTERYGSTGKPGGR